MDNESYTGKRRNNL